MLPLAVAALERDGWSALPGLLSDDEAALLARRCAALLHDHTEARLGDKRSSGTHRAAELLDRVPEVAAVFEHPALREVVAHLLGRSVPLTDVAFRCPQPGFGIQSLHPDDTPVTRAGECRAVTSIVALCDFTDANGATAVLPGSHRRPDLQRRPGRLQADRAEVVLTGPAGTASVFSAHLLHRGTRNRSDRERPALQAQWRTGPPRA